MYRERGRNCISIVGNEHIVIQNCIVSFSSSWANVLHSFYFSLSATTVDNTAPVISNCPSDISLSVGSGVTSVPVSWTEPSAVDDTSAVTVTQTASPGDSFGLGTTQVAYTYSDASGNVAVCSFTITLTGMQVVLCL